MSGFTPGPWQVDETKALGAYGVWTAYGDHPGHDGSLYPSQICSVIEGGVAKATDRDKRDANARLIAAAPDLLEALQGALDVLQAVIPGPHKTIRAAIAKAVQQ